MHKYSFDVSVVTLVFNVSLNKLYILIIVFSSLYEKLTVILTGVGKKEKELEETIIQLKSEQFKISPQVIIIYI